jgi:hypothetical protein
MRKFLRFLLPLICVAIATSFVHGGLVTEFRLDVESGVPNGTFTGTTFTNTLTGLMDNGVTFDATITVEGSGALTQAATGLGVQVDSSSRVSDGESLAFSVSLSNISGGTATFDGFDAVDFNNFGNSDVGFLSVDNSAATISDNFFQTTTGDGGAVVSFDPVPVFHAIAGTGGSNSFTIDDVRASFTGTASTAVPEPSSLLMFGTALVSILVPRKRRR